MADPVVKDDYTALNLYQKLARITGEVGVIAKDGKNTEQNFAFIEYAAVAGRLRELFAKYGVIIIPRMGKQDRRPITSKYGKEGVWTLVKMSFNVINADKPDDKFTVPWEGEGMDYGDKVTNKAATSALKYYLMRQFNISEKGEDPDAHSPGEDKASGDRPQVSSVPSGSATSSDQSKAASKLPVTDDQLDELDDLMGKMKVTPQQKRKTFEMVKTESDFIALRDNMTARLMAAEQVTPPEPTA